MTTTPLEYAPRPPLMRRRRFRRIVGGLLAGMVLFFGWRYGPWAGRRASLLYAQGQCRNYTAPADQIVFETDPPRVAGLAGDPGFVIARQCAWRKPPPAYGRLMATVTAPPALRLGGPTPGALIFLHERRSPDGQPHLICLERTADSVASPHFIYAYDVDLHSLKAATWRLDAVEEGPRGWALDVIDSLGPHNIRIYAGQPDPADTSHFTIRYESQGKPGMIDGYVRNGGQVELKRRDGD